MEQHPSVLNKIETQDTLMALALKTLKDERQQMEIYLG